MADAPGSTRDMDDMAAEIIRAEINFLHKERRQFDERRARIDALARELGLGGSYEYPQSLWEAPTA